MFGSLNLIFLFVGVSLARSQAFGGGGGPFIMQFSPELGELNRRLHSLLGSDVNEIRMIGAGGLVGVTRNLRLGGLAAQGRTKIEESSGEAEFSIGYGGGLVEYVVPLGKLHCFLGAMIGWGSIELKLSRRNWDMNWNDFWQNFEEGDSLPSDDYSGHLSNSFFCYQPYAGLQFALSSWLYLRGSIGYFGGKMNGSNWRESGIKLRDSPTIDISAYRVQVFLVFGWFGG